MILSVQHPNISIVQILTDIYRHTILINLPLTNQHTDQPKMGAANSIQIIEPTHVYLCISPLDCNYTKITQQLYKHDFTVSVSEAHRPRDEIMTLMQKSNVVIFAVTHDTLTSYTQAVEMEFANSLYKPIVYFMDPVYSITGECSTVEERKWISNLCSTDIVCKGLHELNSYMIREFVNCTEQQRKCPNGYTEPSNPREKNDEIRI